MSKITMFALQVGIFSLLLITASLVTPSNISANGALCYLTNQNQPGLDCSNPGKHLFGDGFANDDPTKVFVRFWDLPSQTFVKTRICLEYDPGHPNADASGCRWWSGTYWWEHNIRDCTEIGGNPEFTCANYGFNAIGQTHMDLSHGIRFTMASGGQGYGYKDFYVENLNSCKTYLFGYETEGSNTSGTQLLDTCPTATPTPVPATPTPMPTPSSPSNLQYSCNATGTQATISWDNAANADYYSPRVDKSPASQNFGACNSSSNTGTNGDVCIDQLNTNSYTFAVTPGDTYQWWVHSRSNSVAGWFPPTGVFGANFVCAPKPPTPTVTISRVCLSASTSDNIGTASWTATTPNVTYVDVSTVSNFSSWGYKAMSGGATSTSLIDEFSGSLTSLSPDTDYYVRTWNGYKHSLTSGPFKIPTCPNCSITASTNSLVTGQTGTYTANFSSPNGSLGGDIFYDNFNLIKHSDFTGTTGTVTSNWTPSAAGTYQVCCRAWYDGIAECRPSALVDASPRVACAGPNVCTTVTVTNPTPTTVPPTPTPTTVPPTPTPISTSCGNLSINPSSPISGGNVNIDTTGFPSGQTGCDLYETNYNYVAGGNKINETCEIDWNTDNWTSKAYNLMVRTSPNDIECATFNYCVDKLAPNLPPTKTLSCNYSHTTTSINYFDVNYTYDGATDNGCANLNATPYKARISDSNTFQRIHNTDIDWENDKQSVVNDLYTEGTTVFASVKTRDKSQPFNESDWSANDSKIVNCANCTGTCPTPVPPTPTPTDAPGITPPTATPVPSLTWTINATPVCANGATPTAGTYSWRRIFNPTSDTTSALTMGTHTFTISSTAVTNEMYIGLYDETSNWLNLTGTPPHAKITYGDYWTGIPNATWDRTLPEGTYNVDFEAPSSWCPTLSPPVTPPSATPTTEPPTTTPILSPPVTPPTATPTPFLPNPLIESSVSCIDAGQSLSGNEITIKWDKDANPNITWVDIDRDNSNFVTNSSEGYWHKDVSGAAISCAYKETTAPNGFNYFRPTQPITDPLRIDPDTDYYVRLYNETAHSGVVLLNIPLCVSFSGLTPIVEPSVACLDPGQSLSTDEVAIKWNKFITPSVTEAHIDVTDHDFVKTTTEGYYIKPVNTSNTVETSSQIILTAPEDFELNKPNATGSYLEIFAQTDYTVRLFDGTDYSTEETFFIPSCNQPLIVIGNIFDDTNLNCDKDPGESGTDAATLTLRQIEPPACSSNTFDTTDPGNSYETDGNFEFTNLACFGTGSTANYRLNIVPSDPNYVVCSSTFNPTGLISAGSTYDMLNIGIKPFSPPWFQIVGGGAYAHGNISSPIPVTANSSIVLAPDDVVAASGTIDPGNGTISTSGWKAEGYTVNTNFDFLSEYNKLVAAADRTSNTGTLGTPVIAHNDSAKPYPDVVIYHFTGDNLTLAGNWTNINFPVIILADKDIEISTAISGGTVSLGADGFLYVMAKGNITIDQSIGSSSATDQAPHLEGFFLAGGNISDGGGTKRLNISGSVTTGLLGSGTYLMTRDFGVANLNEHNPTNSVIFSAKLMLNTPDAIAKPKYEWKEVR